MEYEAFVVDKCYNAGEEYFAYKCDNGTLQFFFLFPRDSMPKPR